MTLIVRALLAMLTINANDNERYLVAPSIAFPPSRPTEAESYARKYPFTDEQISVLKLAVHAINNMGDHRAISVRGNTDNVECQPNGPYSPIPDHRTTCVALGQWRASAVAWKLLELGANHQHFAEGYAGDSDQIAPNDSEQNRALNRVVQFLDAGAKESDAIIPMIPIAPPRRADADVPLRNVLFQPGEPHAGTAILTESQKQLIRDVMRLVSHPAYPINVIGHTDDRECEGPVDCNALGLRRATVVVNYLKAIKVPNHVGLPQTFGNSQPKVSNRTEDGRAHNRAVEIKTGTAPNAVNPND